MRSRVREVVIVLTRNSIILDYYKNLKILSMSPPFFLSIYYHLYEMYMYVRVIIYKIKGSYNQRSKCTYQPFCFAIEWWKINMIEFIIIIINRISFSGDNYSYARN